MEYAVAGGAVLVLGYFMGKRVIPALAGLERYTLKDAVYQRVVNPRGGFVDLPIGGKTHYLVEGPKDASELVVFIHGITTSSQVMYDLQCRISQHGYRTVAYDIYGRGHSASPVGVTHNETFFRDQLFQLLDALLSVGEITASQRDKFHLLGYSLGGGIAATFAATHPERLSSLMLLAPAGFVFPIPPIAGIGAWPGMHYILAHTLLGRIILEKRVSRAYTEPSKFLASIREFKMLMYFHCEKKGFFPSLASTLLNFPGLLSSNMVPYYEKVGQATYPVTFLWGKDDQTVPASCSEQAVKAVPRGELKLIEGGHMMLVEFEDVVVKHLTGFLESTKLLKHPSNKV